MQIQARALLALFFAVTMMLPVLHAKAASKQELDANVKATLSKLYKERPAARELGKKARGILVFPNVVKGGIGIGGEYGEGAMLIGHRIDAYYRTISASIGFQLGAQARSQVIMFMTSSALNKFLNSQGWEAGVDGSVAIAEFGAGGSITTETAKAPIIGFILDSKGLMYNLTLEGSKISEIEK
ncbi:BPSL1445 family SYLF domain-containing lipoprotein [Endozoicomonas ascidiicola]|uniref:BPSL1445 family SYLF domain-containing lipoprotein n=1 Tax=Endozoicomonas ascidiicola TaxID=1698521 RepID=UPI00082C0DD5|nr:YSC84-related protein [Endozoicomonas ascidiicola]